MLHGIRHRISFGILGLSLLLAGAAHAATISGVVDLSDTPGFGDAGVQVALTQFDPQQELFNTPTMGQWGLIVTGLLLATIGSWLLIRRRSVGGWGTGVGILLMFLAVIPNVVGTARSVDPVIVTSGAGGTYSFANVAVGSWGISSFRDNYKLTSSSLPSQLVPVALNVASAGETDNVNLIMTPDASCPAASGMAPPEGVPANYWATIKASRQWSELTAVRKAGTQVMEGNATLVRGIGSDFTSVIVPINEPSIASNQTRHFVSHFGASGDYLGSYIIDITSPTGHVDENFGVVPDLVRISTTDGRLMAEARYSNGQLVSQIDGPGMPHTATCLGFAKCLATKWATLPGWVRRICKSACVSCFTTPALGSCSVCAGCVIIYVGNCWCANAPCPP